MTTEETQTTIDFWCFPPGAVRIARKPRRKKRNGYYEVTYIFEAVCRNADIDDVANPNGIEE